MKDPEWVIGFSGHVLAFTGWVMIEGNLTTPEECARMAKRLGARDWKADMSTGQVTMLVHGDLASRKVSERTRQYSKKLILAEAMRRSGKPLVVIDGQGFSDLTNGYPARNRRLQVNSSSEVLVLPELGDGILGGPLSMAQVEVSTSSSALDFGLAALGKGTEISRATVAAISDILKNRGITAQGPARAAPPFDLGWTEAGVVHIAEVLSLIEADEVGQIRSGIRRVLAYAQQLDLSGQRTVQPVLILDRPPTQRAWVADSVSWYSCSGLLVFLFR